MTPPRLVRAVRPAPVGVSGRHSSTLRASSYPFVWAGVYECLAGAHVLEMMPGPSHAMSLVMLRIGGSAGVFFNQLAEHACQLFSTSAVDREAGHVVLSGALHQRLVLEGERLMRFPVLLPNRGRYVLFANRHPAEFAMRLTGLTLLSERLFAESPSEADCI